MTRIFLIHGPVAFQPRDSSEYLIRKHPWGSARPERGVTGHAKERGRSRTLILFESGTFVLHLPVHPSPRVTTLRKTPSHSALSRTRKTNAPEVNVRFTPALAPLWISFAENKIFESWLQENKTGRQGEVTFVQIFLGNPNTRYNQ